MLSKIRGLRRNIFLAARSWRRRPRLLRCLLIPQQREARLAAEREQRTARTQRETEQRQDQLADRIEQRQQETIRQRNSRLKFHQHNEPGRLELQTKEKRNSRVTFPPQALS